MTDCILLARILVKTLERQLLMVIVLGSPKLMGVFFLGMKTILADNKASGIRLNQRKRLRTFVVNSQGSAFNILGVPFSGPAAEEFLG